jgi:hypothetical protein
MAARPLPNGGQGGGAAILRMGRHGISHAARDASFLVLDIKIRNCRSRGPLDRWFDGQVEKESREVELVNFSTGRRRGASLWDWAFQYSPPQGPVWRSSRKTVLASSQVGY